MDIQFIKSKIKGEVADDRKTRTAYSRDTSLFEVTPSTVVFPKDVEDVKQLVRIVSDAKKAGENVSLTARSAGSDMSGGPLTESIVMDFTKHFTRMVPAEKLVNFTGGPVEGFKIAEPGVFYRDFEKETLTKNLLLPTYPASRNLCAIGGMVSNDSGGEKTLRYGKTHDYVRRLKAVFADGNEYEVKPLTAEELRAKEAESTFEGEVYRKVHALLEENYDAAHAAKPNVSKNSAGYNVWDVWDRKRFDLTKLIVGSQGTLAFVTEAEFRLVETKPYAGMITLFLNDIKDTVPALDVLMPLLPTSLESFDDKTFELALKYFWGFLKMLALNPFSLMFAFLPEFIHVVRFGMPKLIILAEFEGNSQEEVDRDLNEALKGLEGGRAHVRVARTKRESAKYWAIRRESFNLLRQRVRGMQTAPFVDDIIVRPEHIPEFLPKLLAILNRYGLFTTIAAHIGDGNFHIIPLMKLGIEEERAKIHPAMDEVYKLVLDFKGSITAEHNDGLIRSPYLEQMYGSEVFAIFKEIKHIFDPLGVMNPGKKVNASMDYAMAHIKRS